MNEIHEGSGELDKYLYSLLEKLRTKYYNVSVNRQSTYVQFFYSKTQGTFTWCNFKIPNTEILGYYMTNEVPPQILQLI